VRPAVTVLLSSILAAACSQLLGIDGRYSREDQPVTASGGHAEGEPPDAGNRSGGSGGAPDVTPGPPSAGGAGGVPGELGPPPFEAGGAEGVTPPEVDAGRQPCAAGSKVCGDGCSPMTPENGCGSISCEPCGAHANARTSCSKDGACEAVCNTGFVPPAAGPDCVPQPASAGGASAGAGGASSSGGASQSGGAGGTGGSGSVCDPLECPACNRGFEGCCIPAVPGGLASRCGCFYFPPLCTTRVG
jgi:hypothetical protein